MAFDLPLLILTGLCGVLTFFASRRLGKGFRERRAARQAAQQLAGQSRQVRRAQARKKRH